MMMIPELMVAVKLMVGKRSGGGVSVWNEDNNAEKSSARKLLGFSIGLIPLTRNNFFFVSLAMCKSMHLHH